MRKRPRSRLLPVLLAGLLLGPGCVRAERAPRAAPAAPPDALLLAEEAEIANLVNEYRAQEGFPALAIDPRLSRAARGHSRSMARRDALEHFLDGTGPQERAANQGFPGPVYENIAGGSSGPARTFFDLWVGSSPHRSNLVAIRTGVMGVGFARAPSGARDYYTVLFGTAP